MVYQPGSALRKVTYLIGSQLLSRVLTFALNVVVARRVGLQSYGLATVNLYLLDAVILTLAREGFRRCGSRFASEVNQALVRARRCLALTLCMTVK